ncbi:MAG: hypothetical protein R3F59_08275 [Myxococcota bacterium]
MGAGEEAVAVLDALGAVALDEAGDVVVAEDGAAERGDAEQGAGVSSPPSPETSRQNWALLGVALGDALEDLVGLEVAEDGVE